MLSKLINRSTQQEEINDLKIFYRKHFLTFKIRQYLLYAFTIFITLGSLWMFMLEGLSQALGIGFAILITSTFVSCWSLFKTLLKAKRKENPAIIYCHENSPEKTYITKKTIEIDKNCLEGKKPFSKIKPSNKEKLFRRVYDQSFSTDTAFSSEDLDNALTLASSIPLKDNTDKKKLRTVFSNNKDIADLQMIYLVSRVGSNEMTFNGQTLSLDSSISELLMAAKDSSFKVKISKSDYFEKLVTQEAFRSKIFIKESRFAKEELFADLTRYFPINSTFQLESQPIAGVSHGIGVTTLAITSDNYLIFFTQSITSAQSSTDLVPGGSGSADYSDFEDAFNKTDLGYVIRYGMARELLEESGILMDMKLQEKLKVLSRREKKLASHVIHQYTGKTKLIGFFRWVNRCGKPEFIGVTKLGKKIEEIRADNFEVANSEKNPIQFSSLDDIKNVKEQLKTRLDNGQKIALCFFAALERLHQISEYKSSKDLDKLRIYENLNQFLFH